MVTLYNNRSRIVLAPRTGIALGLGVIFGVLSGCVAMPVPLAKDELAKVAFEDRRAIAEQGEPIQGPISMAEAVARALKYNLGYRTRLLEEAVAEGQLDLDKWELLPDFVANVAAENRTRDRSVFNSNQTISSATAEKNSRAADIGFSWNVLDFGISYYTAKQNANRFLAAQERRRKTLNQIVQEVRSVYWRAVALETLKERIRQTVTLAEGALKDIDKVTADNLRGPIETLRFKRDLLDSIVQLERVKSDLATAKVELAGLINLVPGTAFEIVIPEEVNLSVPSWKVSLDQMEEIALVNNPDIREGSYEKRIVIDESKKALIGLFPGVTLLASRQHDANSFLVNNDWYQISARLSWNILDLASAPDRLRQGERNEQLAHSRRVALTMAVLVQLHVSYADYLNARNYFDRADAIHAVDDKIAQLTRLRQQENINSVWQLVVAETSAVVSAARRYQSYAEAEAALARMYSTLGSDIVEETYLDGNLPKFTDIVGQSLLRLDKGELPLLQDGSVAGAADPNKHKQGGAFLPVPARSEVGSAELAVGILPSGGAADLYPQLHPDEKHEVPITTPGLEHKAVAPAEPLVPGSLFPEFIF